MLKLKSDKGFFEFFTSGGRAIKVGGLLLLGLLLIFLGGFGESGRVGQTQSIEERAAEMCSMMNGVGECRVMMTYDPDDADRVYAVLILCDGADSVAVREKVTSLFCSLYGIGSHRVEIQKLSK